MALQRVPKGELSAAERGMIVGAKLHGATHAEAAALVGCTKSTVTFTLQRMVTQPQLNSRPRSGRPKVLSERDIRRLLWIVRRNPSINYKTLQDDLGLPVSQKTLYRTLLS